jgi:4a-hydroxytetrahydrobiopterin dehydratase
LCEKDDRMPGFSSDEIEKRLSQVPGWNYSDGQIAREFNFGAFMDGIEFVHRVAEIAEQLDHHPDIDVRYSTVRVAVSSHDVGGITDRDFRVADRINALA